MNHHSFLGPIGGPEIIMILLVLGIPVVIVVVVIAIVRASSSGNSQHPYPMAAPPPPLPSPQSRLMEIDSLKAQGLISEAEHEEKRRKILEGI